MHKPTLAAAVLVATLCTCSGDNSTDDPATTTEASEPTPAPSTSGEVDATRPTEPPATAATTTTTTTTTMPPPTVEEQIAADYQLVYDGYWACLRAPLNCDISWLVPESESAIAMTNTMQALFDRGRYVGEEDPGYYVLESITIGPDGTTAEVVSCWSSTAILYGPPVDPSRPVGPDNPPTLANNRPDSARLLDRLSLVDTRWAQTGSDRLEDIECPPEP